MLSKFGRSVMPKAQYGSDVVVDMMQRFGIEYASLNPGSSFRGLHDSIVNYGSNNPQIITCQHEEIAVQIAHGYARVTGKPMVAIVHNVVGLLHSCMAIYYASLDRRSEERRVGKECRSRVATYH